MCEGGILPEAPETCNNCPSWNTGTGCGYRHLMVQSNSDPSKPLHGTEGVDNG